MPKDIYFIPLIAEALQRPNPHQAIREAFKEIVRLSKEPGYTQGFSQFQRFMAMIQNWRQREREGIEDTSTEALMESSIKPRRVMNLLDETKTEAAHPSPEMIIEKDGEYINAINLEKLPVTKEIKDIKPGRYEFMLDTGRLLWEETLTEKDLLWSHAFPEQDLPLAAETGEITLRPTREVRVLNGEVVIRVFAGIETGRIEVEVRGEEDG